MPDMKKATREMRRVVTALVTYKYEYYENWNQEPDDIGPDDVAHDLGLDEMKGVSIHGVGLGKIEIKCDNCSDWKPQGEFQNEEQNQGQDFCNDCLDDAEDEEKNSKGYDPQGGDGDDD